jgi:hypothetical protein
LSHSQLTNAPMWNGVRERADHLMGGEPKLNNSQDPMSALGQKPTTLTSANVHFTPISGHWAPPIGNGLRSGTRDEAANLGVAVAVVIGPHNSRAEPVGLSYHCRVRHLNPFALKSHAVVAILRIPIDILHTNTIGKSAA